MGKRSPILGYNHNIRHQGLVFHVQTEDSGVDNPHIFTHLFRGGVIVSTRRLDYDAEADADVVKALMQAQHRAVLKDLRRGAFAAKIAAYFADDPDLEAAPAGEEEPVAAAAGEEEPAAAPAGAEEPAAAPAGAEEQPAAAAAGAEEPVAAAAGAEEQPAAAAAGAEEQPAAAPAGKNKPVAAPAGEEKSVAAPAGADKPVAAAAGKNKPAAAAAGKNKPVAAAAGADKPVAAPAGKNKLVAAPAGQAAALADDNRTTEPQLGQPDGAAAEDDRPTDPGPAAAPEENRATDPGPPAMVAAEDDRATDPQLDLGERPTDPVLVPSEAAPAARRRPPAAQVVPGRMHSDTVPAPRSATPADAAHGPSLGRTGSARFAIEVAPDREVLSLADVDEVLSLAGVERGGDANEPGSSPPAAPSPDPELSAAFDAMRGAEPVEDPPVRVTWAKPTRRTTETRKPVPDPEPSPERGGVYSVRPARREAVAKGTGDRPSTIHDWPTAPVERRSSPAVGKGDRRSSPPPIPREARRPSPPKAPAGEAKPGRRHTPGGVVVSRPSVIIGSSRRDAGERAAPAGRERSRVAREEISADTVFGGDLISEKSLDEVILAYLSEDGGED